MSKRMSYARKFARRGGKAVVRKRGSEYMALIGRKGGLRRVDNLLGTSRADAIEDVDNPE